MDRYQQYSQIQTYEQRQSLIDQVTHMDKYLLSNYRYKHMNRYLHIDRY